MSDVDVLHRPMLRSFSPSPCFTLTYMCHLLRSCSSELGRPPLPFVCISSPTMAKRPGSVDLGYIEHVHQRARTLGVDDLSADPIEDFVTENLQDHIRCLQHATQRAWTREFNDWCTVNHRTPTTGQEVCTLVDEFLAATPEKPHKKQLKLLGRFLCQREALFTNYNQGMRCQWCKTPHSSEMLLSLLYPTADWNWTTDCARFCYNCMTNQDDHYPLIPGSWLHDEWDMRPSST